MSVQVTLPDELAAKIDRVATNRTAFVAEAVRRALRQAPEPSEADEVSKINRVADELNRESAEVLEFQTIP